MPYTQPSSPPQGRFLPQADGSHLLTLLPGDPRHMEFVWGEKQDRPFPGVPFSREVEAGIVEAVVPKGHEWCLWQWHVTDNDPTLTKANPFLILVIVDGVGEIRVLHEHSTPFDRAKTRAIKIAAGLAFEPGRLYTWRIDACFAKDGFVRIRRDGVLIADYEGSVGYNQVSTRGPYFKAGIYKWAPFEWAGRIVVKIKP